ncbi:MAG: hypothetical protein LBD35_05210 [Prevotellaceae bacterium]|jgi:hypothetical protein|nr:hypothetical protein [Prevotellaceae bacterium]
MKRTIKRTVGKTAYTLLIITGILFVASANVHAQNEITVGEVKVINAGDGRLLFREYKSEKPLNGQHRIIDGYRSEYRLAEFENGFYNGSYQFFKSDKLTEQGGATTRKRNITRMDFATANIPKFSKTEAS